jgi:hypothetical protein
MTRLPECLRLPIAKPIIMKTCIQTLAIMALAASFSFAEEAPKGPDKGKRPNPEKLFKKLDTDNTGSLSLDEFKASPMAKRNPEKAEQIFNKMDKDSADGVSLEEFKAHAPGNGKDKGKGKKKPAEPAAE